MMKRIAALLLAMLLSVPAQAENSPVMPDMDATWFYPMLYVDGSMMHLLTDAQLDAIAALPSEEIHAIVEALFLAANAYFIAKQMGKVNILPPVLQ